MLNNVEHVEKWIRDNKLIRWNVSHTEQGNSFVFMSDEDVPLETNLSNFRNMMDYVKSGKLFIVASKNEGKDTRNLFKECFSTLNTPLSSAIGNASSAFVPEGYVSKSELENLLSKERMSFRLERLEDELKTKTERIKELETPTQDFFRSLAPLAPPIIQGLAAQFIPAAQIPVSIGRIDVDPQAVTESQLEISAPETEFLSEEENTLLNESLTAWSNADDDWLILLEKIAKLAAAKNPFYSQAKSLLLNM